MSKHIKDIEKSYDLLVEARDIFRNLNRDAVVELTKIKRWCTKVDNFLSPK